jgi:hypothetical protein
MGFSSFRDKNRLFSSPVYQMQRPMAKNFGMVLFTFEINQNQIEPSRGNLENYG